MTGLTRKIIHCDCDCFYASIEMRDDPTLRGRPLAVGGQPNSRGVVATCNYEARRFGIHSAMASARAIRLCPELLIIPPAMEKYRIASNQIMDIYRDYTDLVEPLSLDEAYLDVTRVERCQGSATLIAREIRQRIADTVGITASAGVAPNKFVAKIASDWNKPDGLFVVRPEQVDAFVAALPVDKLHGVGKVTGARLKQLGVQTCADLRAWDMETLREHFGSFGGRLFELSRGVDVREVSPTRERKSISVENTFVTDLTTLEQCQAELETFMNQLDARIRRADAQGTIQKLFVKLRFADFSRTTAEGSGSAPDEEQFRILLATAHKRALLPVRLMGIGVRLGEAAVQLDLFARPRPTPLVADTAEDGEADDELSEDPR